MKKFVSLLSILCCSFLFFGCGKKQKITVVCVNPFLYENANTQLDTFLSQSGHSDYSYIKPDIEMYISNVEAQFSQQKKYALVDRSKIEAIINEEHSFELSEFSSSKKIAEIGKALNANKIITFEPRYSLKKEKLTVSITVAISDVNTIETEKVHIDNIYGFTGKLKYPKIKTWNITVNSGASRGFAIFLSWLPEILIGLVITIIIVFVI